MDSSLIFTEGEGLLSNREFFMGLSEIIDRFEVIQSNKKIFYYNVPAAFDIEVSSFYDGIKSPENKRGIMYVWQFGIWNLVTTGRTWEQFYSFISVLREILGLSDKLHLIVYVHNLPYEFQFIRKRFEWSKVFLLDDRKPVYADSSGLEFRCSLKLAGGKSLRNVGKDLVRYKKEKKTGDLDYELIRTPLTPLSDKEMKYCENDIRVLLCYIQEKIEMDGDITRIPLTNTGYVRLLCRKKCFTKYVKYRGLMDELTVDSDEYSKLKRAFQGGFTHANAHYVKKILSNVGSHDFTSSYPAVMVLEQFPMSKFHRVHEKLDEDRLRYLLLNKCCLFDVELRDVIPKRFNEHPISASKCWRKENWVEDNGRIVVAEMLATTITEQDYFIYKEFYDFEMTILSFGYYEKGYLPKNLVLSILEFYEKKTVLKGTDDFINYMISKNMLNACFGMMVTDIVRDEWKYVNDRTERQLPNVDLSISKYNDSVKRFLFYPWGVWVTAYARANLFSAIISIGDDYVYSDTDSVKTLHTPAHERYFNEYDKEVLRKIQAASEFHKIPLEKFIPVDKTGKRWPIGTWDDEGIYKRFKTLGAKRYLIEKKNGKHVLTVSGANKEKSMEFLMTTGSPFAMFDEDLVIPKGYSGRLIATYIDDETSGIVCDFNGVPCPYHELSSVHMEPSDYSLTISEKFNRYLKGLEDISE